MKQIKSNKQSRKTRIKGRGDYTVENSISDPIKRIEAKVDHIEKSVNRKASAKGAASTIGRTLGNFVNQGDMGALAGETLAKLFGHGDYSVKSNSLIPHPGQHLPKFSSNHRGTRIIEREYIGDIVSGALSGTSSAFFNVNYPINPTNPQVFPWLSTIASLYDQWEPNGIVFEFVSTSSEYNGVNQALGTVIMATDYDIQDPLFTSKQQMENADYACSTKPAVSLMHGIECDPAERPTKVMYTSVGATDARFSVLGNFQCATQGMSSANVNLGELWVSYDITFYKKQQLPLSDILPFYYGLSLTPFSNSGKGLLSGINTISSNGLITVSQTPTTSILAFDRSITSGRFLILMTNDNWQGEIANPVSFNCVGVGITGPIPYGSGFSLPSPGVIGALRISLYAYNVTASGATLTFPVKLVANSAVTLTVLQMPFTVGLGG